ncbi:MAG: hypothetical protein P4L03_05915 [Terracidiphilus sp.]|nr:hypothetical protein [Terracidiphilus sp.]
MELVLNLVWLLAAAALVCLWLPRQCDSVSSRRFQFAAIFALVVLLFPVISVTDDLQAALNPAETDSVLRRDLEGTQPHSIFPTGDSLPEPVFQPVQAIFLALTAVAAPAVFSPSAHVYAHRFNRPPPAA